MYLPAIAGIFLSLSSLAFMIHPNDFARAKVKKEF